MLRIGVIGAGHWGPNLIRNFQYDRRTAVVRVADTSQERLEMVSSRHPDVNVTTSADELLTASDVDAVVVTTPTRTHYELAAKALESLGSNPDTDYHVCTVCGNTVEGEPPEKCPVCGAAKSAFEKVD